MQDRTDPTTSLRTRLFGTTAIAVCAAALYALSPGDAEAAGFALKEQSTTALGNAFAGATAGAEDVTYMYFNPAGLTRHDESQAAVSLSYIIPQGETNNAVNSFANPTPPPPTLSLGGEANSGDAAKDALVPAAYFMWSVNPDLKLAVGVNTPFGLTTEYSQTWAGRFDAVESSIITVNINPAVAYRITESLSLGAGIQIQYLDVTLSQILDLDPSPAILEALGEVTADDWAFGANVGLLYEFSESTRVGLSYRSRISHELKGDFTAGGIPVSGANADFTAPDLVTIGAYHDYSEKFAVMAEAQWQGWSTFDELRIVDDSGTTFALTPENWEDVWFFSLGATLRPNERWTVRGGAAYEESPVPDAFRTPRLTDADRVWIAAGIQYKVSPNFSIDAGYTHIFVDDSSVNLPDRTAIGGPPALTADYKNSVDIITAQLTWRF